MVSQIDVAKKAGVSTMTVSRVINNFENVKEKTRKKVLKVVQDLGYYPNSVARALNINKTRSVGVTTPETESIFDTQYFVELLKGVESNCMEREYNIVLNPSKSQGKNVDYLCSFMERMVDGFLVITPRSSDKQLVLLKERNIPFVVIDGKPLSRKQGVVYINSDHYGGGVQAVEYLISLGHRRIAHITGMLDILAGWERLKAYKYTMKKHGLPLDPYLIVEGDFDHSAGIRAMEHFLSLKKRPTAVFAGNDFIAAGVIEKAREAGLEVPSDISIIGFDDLPVAVYVRPNITTIRQSIFQIGYKATGCLLDQIEKKEAEKTYFKVSTELVVRFSTAPVK